MTVLLFLLALWLGYLGAEALRLRRWREAIPLRITVTGTRGKTSVVRMLAASLREDGWNVLAKSTGAEAVLILPEGEERPVRRRGRPSILEQIRVMALGAKLKVDATVVEVMSVHEENHRVEAGRILRPHLVLATNFRVDHLDAQGPREMDVARVLALDVPGGSRALVPESEWNEAFAEAVRVRGGRVDSIPESEDPDGDLPPWSRSNRELVLEACRILGVAPEAAALGVREAPQDLGAVTVWRYPGAGGRRAWRVVNAFAANDPESTFHLCDWVAGAAPGMEVPASPRAVGLLSLRGDRGDRTLLWSDALAREGAARFGRIYVHGRHAHALTRRLKGGPGPEMVVLFSGKPASIMEKILVDEGSDPDCSRGGGDLLIGFGNLGGLGEAMVRHWRSVAEPLDSIQDPEGPQRGTHGI